MHRCHVDPSAWSGRRLRLSAEETHHLLHVLRASPGAVVRVFDGQGREGTAVLDAPAAVAPSFGGAQVSLRLLEESPEERPVLPITLIQAIAKGTRMDWIVEKATEIGVDMIVPLRTERVVVRLDAEKAETRGERWSRIAQAAAKQSGATRIPVIGPVVGLVEALAGAAAGGSALVVGSLSSAALPIWSVADQMAKAVPRRRVALLIGPEGDWTPGELAQIRGAGAVEASFGPRVLRVETAAVLGLSVLAAALFTTGALSSAHPGTR